MKIWLIQWARHETQELEHTGHKTAEASKERGTQYHKKHESAKGAQTTWNTKARKAWSTWLTSARKAHGTWDTRARKTHTTYDKKVNKTQRKDVG